MESNFEIGVKLTPAFIFILSFAYPFQNHKNGVDINVTRNVMLLMCFATFVVFITSSN